MKLIKKVAAGLLLTLGTLFLVVGAYTRIDYGNELERDVKSREAMAYFLLGLPLTGVGGWIAFSLYQQAQKEAKNRLRSIFYGLLKEGNGQLTLLGFAMEAQLSAEAARQYLEQKAKEFNATFNVSDKGGIVYIFDELSILPPPESDELSILPPPESAALPSVPLPSNYWTLGSTRDDVLRIQGTPTEVNQYEYSREEKFNYGRSSVSFKNGRVAEYHNYDKNLKVLVGPSSPKM